jgi:hypothetical protein
VPDCEEFYKLRDLRTDEYVGEQPYGLVPVHVGVGAEVSGTPAGQLALLALANQLARVHRQITFDIGTPDARLTIAVPFARATLGDTLLSTVRRIDPCGGFGLNRSPAESAVSIGIGHDAPGQYDWYIGAECAMASLSKRPSPIADTAATLRGAALASCLGAAALFRSAIGLESTPRTLSAWNYLEGSDALPGPASVEPLDVGRVLIVGAGAVAAALIYWLRVFGCGGAWTVLDRDLVALHNTNRGMLFIPADAGWPDGTPRAKAEVLADFLLGARVDRVWYDESMFAEETYDVVLGLANERDVRHQIACRNNTVTLHATTGTNWLSQMHRHIIGVDDCIWCRAGEVSTPKFQCSTAEVGSGDEKKSDAALPFLSAASGLMLAVGLQRLQQGDLAIQDRNDWRWDFGSMYRMVSSSFRRCHPGCARIVSSAVRQWIHSEERWRHLDRPLPSNYADTAAAKQTRTRP